jgi:hypothetical protein
MAFKQTWALLQTHLRAGDAVSNWTAHRGLLGDTFTVRAVQAASVEVLPPKARNIQRIPQRDFEIVYAMWNGYLTGTVPRPKIRDSTRFSKYIISIYRWLEQQCGVPLP